MLQVEALTSLALAVRALCTASGRYTRASIYFGSEAAAPPLATPGTTVETMSTPISGAVATQTTPLALLVALAVMT